MTETAISLDQEGQGALPNVERAFQRGWDFHKDRHCIWIVSPTGYVHSKAFAEVAASLSGAFSELGGSAPVVSDISQFAGRAPVVFGANMLSARIVEMLPPHSILVNLEQIVPGYAWFKEEYKAILKAKPILDYSQRNKRNLLSHGIDNVDVLEIGYHSSLTRIPTVNNKDIDVLFYGSMGERRSKVLRELAMAGLQVVHLFGEYGAKRDMAISRSKVVLNMHHSENGVFEIVRVSYLLANKICVLTEGDPADPEIQPFAQGMAIEPYERLVERCIELCRDSKQRGILAGNGQAAMKARSQAAYLRDLMNQRSP
jgi:hypothetical protein